MKLTLFSDYSLRILMYAALRGDAQFSIDEVANSYGLSRHHVAKVVNFLTQNDYLTAQRGRGGGLYLGRDPMDINLGEVARRTENGAPLVECFDAATNSCVLAPGCALKHALATAQEAFFKALDGYTLADLVRKSAPLRRALQLS